MNCGIKRAFIKPLNLSELQGVTNLGRPPARHAQLQVQITYSVVNMCKELECRERGPVYRSAILAQPMLVRLMPDNQGGYIIYVVLVAWNRLSTANHSGMIEEGTCQRKNLFPAGSATSG